MLVKQLMLFCAAALIALPLLNMWSNRSDEAVLLVPEAHEVAPTDGDGTPVIPAVILPSIKHAHAPSLGDEYALSNAVHPSHIEDLSIPEDSDAPLAVKEPSISTPAAYSQPVTFALIMWSEDSASEGAILLKVWTPFFMYGPAEL